MRSDKKREHTGEGERNRTRKRNPKWKKSEEGKEKSGGRNGSEIRRQRGKRNPAKVRLASREEKQPGPRGSHPHPQEPRRQQEILTKQQNSFSILDLNYSPFPSAVSARTYNRELLREPPVPLGTHPCLGHPPLGRWCLGRLPRRGGRAGRWRQHAQSQDKHAEQHGRGAVQSHGGDCGRGPSRQLQPPGRQL